MLRQGARPSSWQQIEWPCVQNLVRHGTLHRVLSATHTDIHHALNSKTNSSLPTLHACFQCSLTFDSSWKALAWTHPGPLRRAPSPSPSFGNISGRAYGFAPPCASLSETRSSSTPCRVAPAPGGTAGVRRESIVRYSEVTFGGYPTVNSVKTRVEGEGTGLAEGYITLLLSLTKQRTDSVAHRSSQELSTFLARVESSPSKHTLKNEATTHTLCS